MKSSKSELPFLTFSSDPRSALRDPHLRHVIRVTATRSTRARRRSDFSEQQHQQSDATLSASPSASKSRFRIKSTKPRVQLPVTETKALQQSPTPQICLWDPIIEPLGGGSWQLLHYYRFDFRSKSWALSPKADWFAFIIEDPAATHATLSFVSLNRDLEVDGAVSAWSLHHRTRAVQIIRNELKKSPSVPKDSLIGAIALLAITEGLEGQQTSFSTHAEALSTLIRLRGGPDELQGNEPLSRLVAWADLCYCSSSGGRTIAPASLDKTDVKHGMNLLSLRDQAPPAFTRSAKETLPQDIADLVLLLNRTPSHPPTDETSAQERQDVCRLIDVSSSILSVLCCATQVYIALVLRQMPPRTKIVVERTERLRESLNALINHEAKTHIDSEASSLIKLWAETVHFCSIRASDGIGQHTEKLRLITLKAGVKDLADFEGNLSKIAWIRPFYRPELQLVISHLHTKSKST